MADKTTTLKTKTNDNVYPNVIGDNRKNAFVDSSTITHHFYDQTHKVGFQIANETNIKIQNSLQKPAGLTKTELVGVGTNGQENIEIGDNLTLANGKLSATGGGSGVEFNELVLNETGFSGNIDENKVNLITVPGVFQVVGTVILNDNNTKSLYGNVIYDENMIGIYKLSQNGDKKTLKNITIPARYFTHFITLTNDNDRIYFQFTDNNQTTYSMSVLSQVISNKKMVCTGVLGNSDESLATPLYVSGTGSSDIEVYYVLKSDTSGTIYHKSVRSFTISQEFYPIDYQI